MSGIAEHVVSRRLGHLDIQTTQNLYGWVSEDAEQRTVAQWQQLTAGWRTDEPRSLAPRSRQALDGSGLYTEERNLAAVAAGAAGAAADGVLAAHAARIIRRFAGGWRAGRSGAGLIWVRCPSRCSATSPTACGGSSTPG